MRVRRLPAGAADLAPAALIAALLVWLAVRGAGFDLVRWTPVAIVAVVLLTLRLAVAPPTWRAVPRPVLIATAALGAYAAWSGLSIAWAQDKGIAWEGANRTVLYFVIFALLALWPVSARGAGAVLAAWALAIIVFAFVTLAGAVSDPRPLTLFLGERFLGPGGYVNASAALFLMVLWPAARLAAARETPWLLRALLAGGAVGLCDAALLSQSRGSLIAAPLTALLLALAGPSRVRFFYTLAAIGGGVAFGVSSVLDTVAAVRAGRAPDLQAVLDHAVVGGLATGLLIGLVGLVEGRGLLGAARERMVGRFAAVLATLAVLAAVVGALSVLGSPASAASRAWNSFKGGYAERIAGTRLTSGLGSNRYDFYRTGLGVFRDHPLGIGADNFKAPYLREGRSYETPTYPHSVEIRTLVSTGVPGAVLLLAFLGAWAAAVWRRLVAGHAGALVAAAGMSTPAYWLIHGSADWFWEFAGLGAAAFALAGLAVAAAPEPAGEPGAPPARLVVAIAAVLCGLAAVAALAPPWLAQREIDAAGRTFATRPGPAIARLRSASALNPLDRRPLVIEGSAWLRLGDLQRARAAFTAARRRDPGDAYSVLELGAIASATGDTPGARRLLGRAVALAPRDRTGRAALAVVRSGRMVDLARLQAQILSTGRPFRTSGTAP